MERFDTSIAAFEHALQRSSQMISLYDALMALRPRDPANDDALRSAYIQAVSSFDFFAHELALVEAVYRFANCIRTRNISLPMEIVTISDLEVRINEATNYIRSVNSYKAFVDPNKLAEMLSCYCLEPWNAIFREFSNLNPDSEFKDSGELKALLKNVWKRRNQIAHEADVNPTFSGVSLWPIYRVDAEFTISLLRGIGKVLPTVISGTLE
jgi:hypothetical protein